VECKNKWNIKTKVILVTIGATGTISKLIQQIPEQHTKNAQNQGTTENSHIGHCTHTAESTNVNVNKTGKVRTT
jgi:hypothetical protein